MDKRRKIFDDGAATVEEVSVTRKKNDRSGNVDSAPIVGVSMQFINISDVIDMFAGYLPAQVNFMDRDGGKCLICGAETSGSMRKICFECLQKHGENIYNKTKRAVKNHEDGFQI